MNLPQFSTMGSRHIFIIATVLLGIMSAEANYSMGSSKQSMMSAFQPRSAASNTGCAGSVCGGTMTGSGTSKPTGSNRFMTGNSQSTNCAGGQCSSTNSQRSGSSGSVSTTICTTCVNGKCHRRTTRCYGERCSTTCNPSVQNRNSGQYQQGCQTENTVPTNQRPQWNNNNNNNPRGTNGVSNQHRTGTTDYQWGKNSASGTQTRSTNIQQWGSGTSSKQRHSSSGQTQWGSVPSTNQRNHGTVGWWNTNYRTTQRPVVVTPRPTASQRRWGSNIQNKNANSGTGTASGQWGTQNRRTGASTNQWATWSNTNQESTNTAIKQWSPWNNANRHNSGQWGTSSNTGQKWGPGKTTGGSGTNMIPGNRNRGASTSNNNRAAGTFPGTAPCSAEGCYETSPDTKRYDYNALCKAPGSAGRRYPTSDSCFAYFECVQGHPSYRQCKRGCRFVPETMECLKDTATTNQCNTKCPINIDIDPNNPDGFLNGGVPQQCRPGTFFDLRICTCDHKYKQNSPRN